MSLAAQREAAAQAAPTSRPAVHAPPTYGLDSLMLIVTLIALCLGAFAVAPGFGIVLVVPATLAVIRTAIITRQKEESGERSTTSAKVLLFAGSLGVVVVTGIAAAIAGYVTCWGGFITGMGVGQLWEHGDYGALGTGIIMGAGLGTIVAIYVFYKVARRLWPAADVSPAKDHTAPTDQTASKDSSA